MQVDQGHNRVAFVKTAYLTILLQAREKEDLRGYFKKMIVFEI